MDLERIGRMIMTMRNAPGLLASIGSTLIRFLMSLKKRLNKSMRFLKHVLTISNSMFQLIKLTPLIFNFISRFFTECLQRDLQIFPGGGSLAPSLDSVTVGWQRAIHEKLMW
jgi:hypothetical protein